MSVYFRCDASSVTAAEYSSAPPKENNIAVPYPGLPANFVLKRNIWDEPQHLGMGAMNCRIIRFESTTETSLMRSFTVTGSYNGDVNLQVGFQREYSKVDLKNFLNSNDLNLMCGLCVATTNKQVSDLFRIIFIHNTIPTDMLDKVREIVTLGRCEPVPQLTTSKKQL